MNDRNSRISMLRSEQKAVMLNILVQFADFCEKNGLQYFLDAGTLLGAVRHQGYIPWDDDIDVNMPLNDYDRFIELTRKQKGYMAPHLIVEYPENTIYPFLKISDDRTVLVEFPDKYPMEVGVYIDIFPKVGIADDNLKTRIICEISAYLRKLQWFNKFSIYAWKHKGNKIQKIVAMIGRKVIKNPNFSIILQDKLIHGYAKKHPLDTCKYVTTLTNGEFINRAAKEYFSDNIMMDFEGKKFRVPIGFDSYLPCLYPGDYMQLPPVEQRRVHHTIIFWKSVDQKNEAITQFNNEDIFPDSFTGGKIYSLNKPLISVIIPVYNVEKFLNRCVQSVLGQTYEQLEVILVDDGSSDSSSQICDEIAAEDSRVKVVHKPNGGQSSARNLGLSQATGDYIGFVDSDDTVNKTMYADLLECIPEGGIASTGIVSVNEIGNLRTTISLRKEKEEQLPVEYLRDLLMYVGDASVCTKLFPAEIFKDFRFDENVLNEDFKFLVQIIGSFASIRYTGKVGYFYLKRSGSTTDGYGKVIEDALKNAFWAKELIAQKYPELNVEVERFVLYQHMIYLLLLPKHLATKENLIYCDAIKYVKTNIWSGLRNNRLAIRDKAILVIQTVWPRLPAVIYQRKRARKR